MSREYSIRKAVREHADASTQDNKQAFYFTPSQARLAWWGMQLLLQELGGTIPSSPAEEEFADDLLCYADAIEWTKTAMLGLATHSERFKLEVLP